METFPSKNISIAWVEKIKEFDTSLNKVLLNLAKRVVADGEGEIGRAHV